MIKRNLLRKNVKCSNTVCWDEWDRLFSNLRLLLSKTQYSSDRCHKFGYSAILKMRRLKIGSLIIEQTGNGPSQRSAQGSKMLIQIYMLKDRFGDVLG